MRTIEAVREAGLETCVGGILNLGESDEQRVEMAFELAEIDPTSVPINLLNPRPGTKFGDREYMDPVEAVKWIAIFRLILPDALFRLCGGRVENIGELQPLAVKAGLNGVMMGNFLTTLGSTPEEDRAMFEELGLNVARQADNGANPRPDNRSRLARGRDARRPRSSTLPSRDADRPARPALGPVRRSCASRQEGERARRGPTGADELTGRRRTPRHDRHRGPARRASGLRPVPAHADGQRAAGPARRAGRQAGAAAVLEQLPRAGRPPARARGRRRRGDALGRRRRRVAPGRGHDDDPPPARGAAGRVQAHRGRAAVRLGLPGQPRRRSARWRGPGEVVLLRRAQPRLDRRRLPAGPRRDVRLRPLRPRAPRVGCCARPTGAPR